MKKSIAIIFIFLFVIGLMPWLDGYYYKQHYLQFISNIVSEHQSNIKIDVLTYRLGWLSSSAQLQVTPTLEKQGGSPKASLSFIVDQTISHGPLIYDNIQKKITFAMAAVQSSIHFPAWIKQALGNQTNSTLQINSLANFNGDCFNQIEVPLITLPIKEIGTLTWQGLTGDLYFKVDQDRMIQLKSNFNIGAVSAIGENEGPLSQKRFTIQPISTHSDVIREPIGIWSGKAEILIP